jgi:hypothetical protein
MLDTGFPRADVENDFLRARRRQFLVTLAHRLRGRRGDGNRLVPLDDVVAPAGTASGSWGCRRSGWKPSSAQRTRDATSTGASGQPPAGCGPGGNGWPWPSGAAIPPIEVYRVG